MAHSIELLPDDDADVALRAQWAALSAAGLPSAGDIRSKTNRPHLTQVAARRIPADADTALIAVAQRLPLRAALGAPIVFGHGARRTLARLVVPNTELLSVHAQVLRLLNPLLDDELFEHSDAGAWTPHITLARHVPVDQLGPALHALDTLEATAPTAMVGFVALRRWDSDSGTDHITPGRSC